MDCQVMQVKEKLLYALWAGLYIVCVGLGTVDGARGFGKALLVATSLIFFLPGIGLLLHGIRAKNPKVLLRVRIVSIVSLSLTLVLLVANFLSIAASEQTGKVLQDILLLVSAPMFCSQYWVLSLFLWGCLLSASITERKRCVNNP